MFERNKRVTKVQHFNADPASRRLVERDPWADFVASAQSGRAVRGQVVRVMPYEAFVEIILLDELRAETKAVAGAVFELNSDKPILPLFGK